MGRPAFSQLRSTLKAASIRSLPSCKGMTDVLASSRYSNTYFKNYSVVHCQAWMKWYLVNFHIEYGEYMAIHFPIVAQIKRNWGTGKYEQEQFIWINFHQNPFTIVKSPLKQPSTIPEHKFDSCRSTNILETFFFEISLSVRSTCKDHIVS